MQVEHFTAREKHGSHLHHEFIRVHMGTYVVYVYVSPPDYFDEEAIIDPLNEADFHRDFEIVGLVGEYGGPDYWKKASNP